MLYATPNPDALKMFKLKYLSFQDGSADVRDLYNCMEAEDIMVGKTHEHYAIYFQVSKF